MCLSGLELNSPRCCSPTARLTTPTLLFLWHSVYYIMSRNQLLILDTFRPVAAVFHTIALREKMSIGAGTHVSWTRMVRVFVYDEVIELVKDHYYDARVSMTILL